MSDGILPASSKLFNIGMFFYVFNVVNSNSEGLMRLIPYSGLDLGDGVILKINYSRSGRDLALLDRLLVDYSFSERAGVTFRDINKDNVILDFYLKTLDDGQSKARRKTDGVKYLIPIVLGFKTALISALILGFIKLISVKALSVANTALLISSVIYYLKNKKDQSKESVKLMQQNVGSYTQTESSDANINIYHQSPYKDFTRGPSNMAQLGSNSGYLAEFSYNHIPSYRRRAQHFERRNDNKATNLASSGSKIPIKRYS
ncbi:uncharacterized protein LOC143200372 [Rhynchophorus ferrugineus]|uniref:uncharacterized protein LOC143200372 n=1 Tax=Rhynchophorus ferrugineus TaxID=354439 RepID=UPI003FCED5DF